MENDRLIDIDDFMVFRGLLFTTMGEVSYDRRLDLDADGTILVHDVAFRGQLFQTCS